MTITATQRAAAATTHTRLLATELELFHAPGLTFGQREARTYLAAAIADLRYALGEPDAEPGVGDAARRLLAAMADVDDSDQRAARSSR
jgi:hypothetical protein